MNISDNHKRIANQITPDNICILYMEDETSLALLFKRKLEQIGYNVDLAYDGEQGLAMYDPDIHNVVVVDYKMPIYNGLDVIRLLKARGPLPVTIMLTGTEDQRTTVSAIKLGADDYIIKDINRNYLERLPIVIERIIEARQQVDDVLDTISFDRNASDREHRVLAETLRWAGAVVLSSTISYDEILDRILEQANRVTAHDASSIFLLQEDKVRVSRWSGYARFGTERAITSAQFLVSSVPTFQQAKETGFPAVVSATRSKDAWIEKSGQPWIKSYITIPIYRTTSEAQPTFERSESIIGFLNVDSSEPGFFNQIDAERLQAFIGQAAMALGNAELYNQARREITHRMRALKRERNFVSAILDTAGALVMMLNAQGRIIRFNRACEQTSGYSVDEVRGKFLWDYLLHPADVGTFKSSVRRLIKSQGSDEFETEWRTKSGDKHVIAWSNTTLTNSKGKGTYIICIGIDITDRKEIEEALRKSEERYELAVLSANDGLWDWDLNDNKIYYSPRWKELLGYKDQYQLIGDSPIEWFGRIHPEDFEIFKTDLLKHFQNPKKNAFKSQYRILHYDGEYRWFDSQGLAATDSEGVPYRMAGSQTDVTHRKLAESKLMHSALHDALTELPNRTLFMNHLERAIERAKEDEEYLFAVLFLDLDRFKIINDSLGHLAGDELLKTVAHRLRANVRTDDTVARFGGDEFAILVDGIEDVEEAKLVAERIQDALAQPIYLRENRVFTSASIGIALSDIGYDWPQDILRDADTTLYRAKSLGRSRFEVFEVSMRTQAIEAWWLEAELRKAIEQEHFEVYYQPIVGASPEKIVGFEALLRWNHPTGGVVGPREFIPLAEETGLIIPIGAWVLEQACLQLKRWHDEGFSDLRVTVNVSPYQFEPPPKAHPGKPYQPLPKLVKQTLEATNIPPSTLELEITENMTVLNMDKHRVSLEHLKALGIRIAIDDFGMNSSLGFLNIFPLDTLKIDRSLIRDMTAADGNPTFLTAIIAMAHSLNFNVVAEGVLFKEQAIFLREQQCDEMQGYLYSPALPADGATKLLSQTFS